MVTVSDAERSSIRGLFIAWSIALLPAILWSVRVYQRSGIWQRDPWLYTDRVLQLTITTAIVFGTIGYAVYRAVLLRFDGHVPVGDLHPLLDDHRPRGAGGTETALDRVFFGDRPRRSWLVPAALTVGLVAVGVGAQLVAPSAFSAFVDRSAADGWPARAAVYSGAILLSTLFAYRRGGLVGCWGILYGPMVVVILFGSTSGLDLEALIRPISYTATTAVELFLVGAAIRWLGTDTDGRDDHVDAALGTEPS
jgi:hypothetical protein